MDEVSLLVGDEETSSGANSKSSEIMLESPCLPTETCNRGRKRRPSHKVVDHDENHTTLWVNCGDKLDQTDALANVDVSEFHKSTHSTCPSSLSADQSNLGENVLSTFRSQHKRRQYSGINEVGFYVHLIAF
jgi:hypothetical protein